MLEMSVNTFFTAFSFNIHINFSLTQSACTFFYLEIVLGFQTTILPSNLSKALAKRTRKSMQVNASQCKFAKPELAYRLAKGGQTVRNLARKLQKAINFMHILG